MPRYYFNVIDGLAGPDLEGSEFPDIGAAQIAAVRLCGELIKEMDGKAWEEPRWRLQVTGQDKSILLTFTFSVEVHDPDVHD